MSQSNLILSPADQIRGYLEEHGGSTTVPFHNLLTSWKIDEATPEAGEQIDEALAESGIWAFPPLRQAHRGSPVVLALRGQGRERRRVGFEWREGRHLGNGMSAPPV